jgi:hypothetical protein
VPAHQGNERRLVVRARKALEELSVGEFVGERRLSEPDNLLHSGGQGGLHQTDSLGRGFLSLIMQGASGSSPLSLRQT